MYQIKEKKHMDENLDAIRKELKKYSQEHLLTEYERLDETKQKQLLDQIKGIDFGLINSLYNNTRKEFNEKDSQITPIEYLDKNKYGRYGRRKTGYYFFGFFII